ncbi:NADH-quinone oxidoreductase subunit F [Candidatus Xenohaliotis californiensis]|uniref:NADH-quinone oxidoreductase subunit F n=1 Tax=Candidatus Xenohaliotis californiensis TaxID=84677 RepID=A0ABP0ETS2_9RICK|nr:NADH-quinone oxidoreductase subunit F [Candidatus Xenohaliotis californiensis]
MLKSEDRIFTNLDGRLAIDLESSKLRNDWQDIEKILLKGSEWINSEIAISKLRGRGGAGFYTSIKWNFMSKDTSNDKPTYLIVNADESEPGTCKDRAIINYEPHKVIEGAILAAFAIGAHCVYIYIRGEFKKEAILLENAINEAYKNGLIGKKVCGIDYSCDIYVHRGAGAYICGEETALMESLTGNPGKPRNKPPFPAAIGYCGYPTVVNNVETIAVIPTILRRGGRWFSSIGSGNSTGTKVFCISGHVNKPCVVEDAMCVPMRELIEDKADGVVGGWDNLLAVWPGGSSCHVLPRSICERVTMSFESLHDAGSSFGTGGLIVANNTADIIEATENLAYFYMEESCGQCVPCREGTGWIWRLLKRFRIGTATRTDIALLEEVGKKIEGNAICALADAAVWAMQGLLIHFRDEMEKRCIS